MLSLEKSDTVYLRVVIKYDMQHSFKLILTDTEANLKAKTFVQLRQEIARKYNGRSKHSFLFYDHTKKVIVKNEADTIWKDFKNHTVEFHIARFFPCLDDEADFIKYLKKHVDTSMICYMRFDFKTPESYIVLVTLKTHDYSTLASKFIEIFKTLLQNAVTDAVLADLQKAIIAAHPDGSAIETKTVDVNNMIANNQSKYAALQGYKLNAVVDQALKSDVILPPMSDIGKYGNV